MREFIDRFHGHWLVERLGYRLPKGAYAEFVAAGGAVA